MNLKTWIVEGMALLAAGTSAQAELLSRANGQAYYDTELDITWVADANLAQTSEYDSDGWMNWSQAQTWIDHLNSENYLGVNNWRLPAMVQPDLSCSDQSGSVSWGYGCTGSELAHLYNVAGVTPSTPGPFSNVQPYFYWSGTTYAPDASYAWNFYFLNGYQDDDLKEYNDFAWAVHPGDISVVPVPAAGWLFAGALGLMACGARRGALERPGNRDAAGATPGRHPASVGPAGAVRQRKRMPTGCAGPWI